MPRRRRSPATCTRPPQARSEVGTNIAGVTRGATETGIAASQVLDAAGELSRQAESLSGDVQRFVTDVKAA